LALSLGCGRNPTPPIDPSVTLPQARQGFVTKLERKLQAGSNAPTPPLGVFNLVRYKAPLGENVAYLSPDPGDGKKRPAIVWITGGDCNTIDQGCWNDRDPSNDQSASAYRKAGLVMMFPSLRGGNTNPGFKEGFLGEVDDVLAAADFLARQPHVDPQRIYLGGHSTGGTLVLLVSQCSDRFRAVFSFGPADDVAGYGPDFNYAALTDLKEMRLRSPGYWLHGVRSPTFVIEGAVDGNTEAIQIMKAQNTNPKVTFATIQRASHFSVLGPINAFLARKIQDDTGPTCNLSLSEADLNAAFGR
jgi:dipeptidyl aminopeptidase/acylaminoacyl peptidase